LDGFLLVLDAFLELEDPFLSVLLLLLNVLHKTVEDSLGLESLLLGLPLLVLLNVEDLGLRPERGLHLIGLDLG
jgi:hypothetical protein